MPCFIGIGCWLPGHLMIWILNNLNWVHGFTFTHAPAGRWIWVKPHSNSEWAAHIGSPFTTCMSLLLCWLLTFQAEITLRLKWQQLERWYTDEHIFFAGTQMSTMIYLNWTVSYGIHLEPDRHWRRDGGLVWNAWDTFTSIGFIILFVHALKKCY